MALTQTYVVCAGGTAQNATITMTVGACGSSSTANIGGCTVTTKHKTLTFTSNVASDENYTIYFSYHVVYYEDFDYQYENDILGSVTMPAGSTSVTTTTLCDYRASCVGDVVLERDALDDGMV